MINWKRGAVVLLFSLVLFSSVVYGSRPTGVEQLDYVINILFNLNDEVGLKLVFGLLAFTVLFGISEFIFRNWAKGIRFLLALVMSVMTVMFIPLRLLVAISKTYGVVFAFVMIGVPVLGLFYVLFGLLTEKSKATYRIKATICLIAWYIFGVMGNDLKGVFGGGFDSFSLVISTVFLFMTIAYFLKSFTAEPEDYQAVAQRASAVGGWLGSTRLGSWAKSKFVDTVKAEEAFTIEELQIIEKARAAVDDMVREMVFEVKELSKEAGKRRASGETAITEEELEGDKRIIVANVNKHVDGIIRLLRDAERQGYDVFRLARRSRRYSGDQTKIAAQEQLLREKMDKAIAELQAFKGMDVRGKYMEYGELRDNLHNLLTEIYECLALVLKEIKGNEKQAEMPAALPTTRL